VQPGLTLGVGLDIGVILAVWGIVLWRGPQLRHPVRTLCWLVAFSLGCSVLIAFTSRRGSVAFAYALVAVAALALATLGLIAGDAGDE
jgi:hypothetical protein